jgi:cellulose synthase/poly-beta-1,6-N-acetylglucosamine synthase-like glycosyltransferase
MLRIGMYRHYWNKFPVLETNEMSPPLGISVVIAFRNEESSLPALLNSLNNQVYPRELREVILVNDHSTDRSLQIAENFVRTHPDFQCYNNDKSENGKKAAVLKGMHHTTFNLVVFTDADCTMGDNWLSSVAAVFSRQNAGMIIGLVDMDVKPGLFNHFQEIEFLSLVASGAAAAAGGRPIYCNAANLAFRKDIFLSYADPLSSAVPSGDDTLFMLRVRKDPSTRIVLMKSVPGMVTTKGAANVREFFNQRSRWASKSRYYTDRDILYTAGLVLGVSVALLISALALVMGKNTWLFPGLLLAKSLGDYLFLNDFLFFYSKKVRPLLFIVFETIYPLYVLISATMGLFNRYTWKERNFFRARG